MQRRHSSAVRTNGVWTKTTVKSILTNQAYIGSAVHGKVVIEKYNNIPLHATDPSEWVAAGGLYIIVSEQNMLVAVFFKCFCRKLFA